VSRDTSRRGAEALAGGRTRRGASSVGEPASKRASTASEISKKKAMSFLYSIYQSFFLVSVRFDLIRESFYEQAMESSVVRYNNMTLHRGNGKSSCS
jgi:hypothetical protein